MTVPTRLASAGLGLETTYGSPVAPTAALPWTQCEAVDNNALIADHSWRGSAADVYDHETGVQDSTTQLGGPALADTIGYLFAGVLGDYTFTGGTPNTHAFALLNTGTQQPPSYTLTTQEPIGTLQRPGCVVSDLTLSIDAEQPLAFTGSLAGFPSAAGAVTVPAASNERLLPSWAVAATIGGVAEPRLLSASIHFARDLQTKRNADGSVAPWLQRLGALSVTGNVEVAVAVDNYRAGFLTGAATSIDLTYQAGVGAALRQLKLHCSQVALTSLSRDYGGKWIQLAFGWEAEATAADAGASGGLSPVKVTLKNQIGSGVYK